MAIMLGLMLYAIVCFIASWLALALLGFFTKVSRTGEKSPSRRLLVIWLAFLSLPYAWVEAQTALHEQEFTEPVDIAYVKSLFDGEPLYFKVQYATGTNARLLLIAYEDENWGTYRNIYSVRLRRVGNDWLLKSVDPINTFEGDAAGFTFPPYW